MNANINVTAEVIGTIQRLLEQESSRIFESEQSLVSFFANLKGDGDSDIKGKISQNTKEFLLSKIRDLNINETKDGKNKPEDVEEQCGVFSLYFSQKLTSPEVLEYIHQLEEFREDLNV